MLSPTSKQGTDPTAQTPPSTYSMWDPGTQSTKNQCLAANIDTCHMCPDETEAWGWDIELVRTLTPGARAPSNTACADDMSSPTAFFFSICAIEIWNFSVSETRERGDGRENRFGCRFRHIP